MFTGLIEKVGHLVGLERDGNGQILTIEHDAWDSPVRQGESMAVQGICLTVVRCAPRRFSCDILDETLDRTTLGAKRQGARLNLERALRVGDRFGGHFLSGHVDGTGILNARKRQGRDWVLDIACSQEISEGIILKGSIACDGVSLTVTSSAPNAFSVHVIPHTWERTSLSTLQAGDSVNLETDMLGKYARHAHLSKETASNLDMDCLRQAGFVES